MDQGDRIKPLPFTAAIMQKRSSLRAKGSLLLQADTEPSKWKRLLQNTSDHRISGDLPGKQTCFPGKPHGSSIRIRILQQPFLIRESPPASVLYS